MLLFSFYQQQSLVSFSLSKKIYYLTFIPQQLAIIWKRSRIFAIPQKETPEISAALKKDNLLL